LWSFTGKDVYWYTREKGDAGDSAAAAELLAVKQREEELMAEVGLCSTLISCLLAPAVKSAGRFWKSK
jgi:hypothetical protein